MGTYLTLTCIPSTENCMFKRNITAALFIGTILTTSVAQGQSRISPALALARICVSEANWTCFETGDGLAIHEVILRGAERHGMSYVAYAASYSGRVVGSRVPSTERGRWIREMSESGDTPASWPTQSFTTGRDGVVHVHRATPWSHYREQWLAVLARAREVVREYELSNLTDWGVCSSPVHDWGGSMDRDRAERLRLIEVECGGTRNDFYARPSLVIEEDEAAGG